MILGIVAGIRMETLGGSVGQETACGDPRGHVGELELYGLVLADGHAEGRALLRVTQGGLEGGLSQPQRGGRVGGPGEGARRGTEARLSVRADPVESQVPEGQAARAQCLVRFAEGQTPGASLDEEGGQAVSSP